MHVLYHSPLFDRLSKSDISICNKANFTIIGRPQEGSLHIMEPQESTHWGRKQDRMEVVPRINSKACRCKLSGPTELSPNLICDGLGNCIDF